LEFRLGFIPGTEAIVRIAELKLALSMADIYAGIKTD